LTKLASGTTTTYSYNAGDALTVENAAGTLTTYAYDNAGNTSTQDAASSVTTYTWDDENRMTGLVLPSGAGTWTMAYNPSGLRREKQAAGTTTRFLWDTVGVLGGRVGAQFIAPSGGTSRLLQETDGDNATTAHYTAGLGTYGPTVSQRRSSTSSFLHGSLLGTIESLTAADQSVSDTYVLDAWGRQVASSASTTNPHRYIGRLGYYTEPSLSLDYVRARWLRPSTGSWLSVDPVVEELRYTYALDSPTWGVDPLGWQTWRRPEPPIVGPPPPLPPGGGTVQPPPVRDCQPLLDLIGDAQKAIAYLQWELDRVMATIPLNAPLANRLANAILTGRRDLMHLEFAYFMCMMCGFHYAPVP